VRSSLFWHVTQVVTDVLGQPIGPMYKGQAFQQECREYSGAQLHEVITLVMLRQTQLRLLNIATCFGQ
jgi:hypothetical protein